MTSHKIDLRNNILFMLTSCFFIKQLGYVQIFRSWFVFLDSEDYEHRFVFPEFVTEDLKAAIFRVSAG